MGKSRVAIITDSTANIPKDLVEKHNIHVLPLRVNWPGDPIVSLKDLVEISPSEFYEKLKKSEVIPTTSQPSPGEFVEFFNEVGKESKDMVAVLVSEQLSGTYQAAQFALNMVEDLNIELVDSKSAGMGLGLIALIAARAANKGISAAEIASLAKEKVEKSRLWVVVDTLEYLHKGGRVSGTQKMIGSLLNMKPILHMVDGRLELFGSVRTKKKAINTILDIVEVELKSSKHTHMAVSHAVDPELAASAAKLIRKRINPKEFVIAEMSPVIGTHVGPGALGIAHIVED